MIDLTFSVQLIMPIQNINCPTTQMTTTTTTTSIQTNKLLFQLLLSIQSTDFQILNRFEHLLKSIAIPKLVHNAYDYLLQLAETKQTLFANSQTSNSNQLQMRKQVLNKVLQSNLIPNGTSKKSYSAKYSSHTPTESPTESSTVSPRSHDSVIPLRPIFV